MKEQTMLFFAGIKDARPVRHSNRSGRCGRKFRRVWVSCIIFLIFLLCNTPLTTAVNTANNNTLKSVLFVGNNWAGTITVVETSNYTVIGTINGIPDYEERVGEIRRFRNPIRWLYFLLIRRLVGEGNHQWVDDMYSTIDGTALIISRPSLADVISLDLTKNNEGKILWRFPVAGYRSDHMAISPDGTEVAVSASTANVVHLINVVTGEENAQFPTGESPHENQYLGPNGRYVINAGIGKVYTRRDFQDRHKGDRKLVIYDRVDRQIVETIDMRPKLDEVGRSDLNDAVRPFTISTDETTMYFQVSLFNGVLVYDFDSEKITRVIELPTGTELPPRRSEYINDSRHHGLTINKNDTKLCVAGTEDGYATIVDIETGQPATLIPASKPYWSTRIDNTNFCVISESEGDRITIIDFETGSKVLSVDVGDHPQRVRNGFIPVDSRYS